jgi:sugar phosphate isomerase/epimerase
MAGELGAEAVEIDARGEIRLRELSRTGLRHLRKMLEDRDLRVCAVGFRTRRGYDVQEDLDRRVEATKQTLRLAYDLGAPVVINRVGRLPPESAGAEWESLLQAIRDLGAYGQHVGTVLAAETGSEEGADLARLIDALPPGCLGVNLDPGSLIANGFSASAAIDALGAHVLHVHAKDGVRDVAQGCGMETPLGQGSVDFPELIGALEEQGYRGYFTIVRHASSDAVHEIGQAVNYLRAL